MHREQVESIFEQLKRRTQDQHAPAPRTLFVYAHPDDEAIAIGAHLHLFGEALFLQVTDGAPPDNSDGDQLGLSRDEYRATRALEVRAAFASAGLPEVRHRSLNLPDKEVAFHLAELTRQITSVMREERSEVVFTHPYEGGHADHDACCFAVHTAARALGDTAPLILETPFYYANPDGTMNPGKFLQEDRAATYVVTLTPEQQDRKRDTFSSFSTQKPVLDQFGHALVHERFRVAPEYEFREPAVEGVTFYETFIPKLNAVRFSELASEALAQLQSEKSA